MKVMKGRIMDELMDEQTNDLVAKWMKERMNG